MYTFEYAPWERSGESKGEGKCDGECERMDVKHMREEEKKPGPGKCFWLFHLLISFSAKFQNENQLIWKENEVYVQKFRIIHFNLVVAVLFTLVTNSVETWRWKKLGANYCSHKKIVHSHSHTCTCHFTTSSKPLQYIIFYPFIETMCEARCDLCVCVCHWILCNELFVMFKIESIWMNVSMWNN